MYEKGGVLIGKEVVEMVDKWGGGISVAAVERHYGANESTIFFLEETKTRPTATLGLIVPQSVEISSVSRRDFFHEKKETCVCVFLKEETQKWSSLSGAVVRSVRSCQ